MANKRPRGNNVVKLPVNPIKGHRETTYQNVDKDPDLSAIGDLLIKDGRSLKDIAAHAHEVSAIGVSYQTLHRWIYGDTKRPQNMTMTIALRALGYERTIRRIPKARRGTG